MYASNPSAYASGIPLRLFFDENVTSSHVSFTLLYPTNRRLFLLIVPSQREKAFLLKNIDVEVFSRFLCGV